MQPYFSTHRSTEDPARPSWPRSATPEAAAAQTSQLCMQDLQRRLQILPAAPPLCRAMGVSPRGGSLLAAHAPGHSTQAAQLLGTPSRVSGARTGFPSPPRRPCAPLPVCRRCFSHARRADSARRTPAPVGAQAAQLLGGPSRLAGAGGYRGRAPSCAASGARARWSAGCPSVPAGSYGLRLFAPARSSHGACVSHVVQASCHAAAAFQGRASSSVSGPTLVPPCLCCCLARVRLVFLCLCRCLLVPLVGWFVVALPLVAQFCAPVRLAPAARPLGPVVRFSPLVVRSPSLVVSPCAWP